MTSAETSLLPHLSNAAVFQDRISAACNRNAINAPVSSDAFIDPWFGNAWSWTPAPGAALYGRTEDFPSTPIEAYGNGQFLRVPYRRIPVIDVRSIEELATFEKSVVSKDDSVSGVWRGQANQYQLKRSNADRMRLYGDIEVIEPSLPPSASRESRPIADLLNAWTGLLDIFMEQRVKSLSALHPSSARMLLADTANFRCGYNYRLWSFATAQHYGVPSVGLDVTPNILVALFFALHRLKIDPGTGITTITRAGADADPVIYGLGGFEQDVLNDELLSPPWLQCQRPKAQNAMFFHTGWGAAYNKAAQRVYVALRLVDHVNWRSPLGGTDIIPAIQSDEFLKFLLEARENYDEPNLQYVLRKVYHYA